MKKKHENNQQQKSPTQQLNALAVHIHEDMRYLTNIEKTDI